MVVSLLLTTAVTGAPLTPPLFRFGYPIKLIPNARRNNESLVSSGVDYLELIVDLGGLYT